MSTLLPVPKGPIYKDSDHKRELESRNGLIQFAFVIDLVEHWGSDSRLTPEILCELQRLAVNQIYRCAGSFRDGAVSLGVDHVPPDHTEVRGLVEGMCSYVHDNWDRTPIHLASYLMWRMNWIHPFFGGNGRTARALSYLILCARLGFVLPGEKTIPELIVDDRGPYYGALPLADEAAKNGRIDVSRMEDLMDSLLAAQLLSVHEKATGKPVRS